MKSRRIANTEGSDKPAYLCSLVGWAIPIHKNKFLLYPYLLTLNHPIQSVIGHFWIINLFFFAPFSSESHDFLI